VHELALSSAHGVAFHRGLGTPLHLTSSSPITKYLDPETIWSYSQTAYAGSNIAVVANGVEHAELTKWVKEFFTDLHKGGAATKPQQTKYHGGEERIAHDGGNAVVLGFPGSSSFTGGFWKPEIAVLAALLGGESSIKWSPGFSLLSKATEAYPGANVSTISKSYSDAGLLCVSLTGKAEAIRDASKEVVSTIKKVSTGDISKEDFQKAVATAKFRTLAAGQETTAGIEATGSGLIGGGKAHQFDEVAKSIQGVSENQLKSVSQAQYYYGTITNYNQVAKTLLEGKATVSSVGDLYVLPFAEELGLHV
jgi:ubiquinol-cytochrome c reductase core subunit 2